MLYMVYLCRPYKMASVHHNYCVCPSSWKKHCSKSSTSASGQVSFTASMNCPMVAWWGFLFFHETSILQICVLEDTWLSNLTWSISVPCNSKTALSNGKLGPIYSLAFSSSDSFGVLSYVWTGIEKQKINTIVRKESPSTLGFRWDTNIHDQIKSFVVLRNTIQYCDFINIRWIPGFF